MGRSKSRNSLSIGDEHRPHARPDVHPAGLLLPTEALNQSLDTAVAIGVSESLAGAAPVSRCICMRGISSGQACMNEVLLMGSDPKKPEIGDLMIDATDLSEVLVDLPPGARQGMRATQPGVDKVLAEIDANQAQFGERAGVTAYDLDSIRTNRELIARIDELLPASNKLSEILTETRAKLDDEVQRRVSAIATAVETRARASGDQELLGRYAGTREYRSAAAAKAVRTRRRNQEAASPDAPAPDSPSDPDSPGEVATQPE